MGTNEEIAAYIGPQPAWSTSRAGCAVPGFIEGHGHFTGVGQARIILNLTSVKNWDEVVAMVKDAAAKAKPGEWILGRGWHQDEVGQGRPIPPSRASRSTLAERGLARTTRSSSSHASGHASFANAKAMELAGVTRDDHEPAGRRDPEGREGRADRASSARPRPSSWTTPTPRRGRE